MNEERIGEKLKKLRADKNISQRELAKRSGVSREYINQMEAGKVKSTSLRKVEALAHGLGVKTSAFFGTPSPEASLADLELSIKAYIPVYADVSAGPGSLVDYVACTRNKPATETMRAYKVRGLCLSPEVIEGDVLIVDTDLSPNNGDLVVVILNDEASVKRYKEDGNGRKWLENNDGTYQPEDVVLHGVVTGIYRERR